MSWGLDRAVCAGLCLGGLYLGGNRLVDSARAGPNYGGTLLVHDTGLAFTSWGDSYTSPPPTIDPPTVDNNVSPGLPVGGLGWVWKVYAAFPNGSLPRLRGLGFASVFSSEVSVVTADLPDSEDGFVFPLDGWPTSSGGSAAILFGVVKTAQVNEAYWFAGYGYPAGGTWSTAPHANPSNRFFLDDALPAQEDAISGYSSAGFGVDGHTEYPQYYGELGACCFAADGRCETVFSDVCPQVGGSFFDGPCEPNPCPPPSPGACCSPSGFCQFVYAPDCPTGDWRADVACDPNPCPQPPEDAGETVEDALVIDSIPFSDSRSTCGFLDDYDAACPYQDGTAPDRVYRYAPPQDEALTIDLCSSGYDTKVYVYRNAIGDVVACNDDAGCGYSGWQSRITRVDVAYGDTCYVVIDGSGAECGEYALNVAEYQPCVLPCPPGALLEGEAGCYDGYHDDYDGGCNGAGWISIEAQADGCAEVCGTSCTYLVEGLSYRDTDWYEIRCLGGPLTFTTIAEFPLQCLVWLSTNCGDLHFLLGTAVECVPLTLTWPSASPNQEMWLWVGPSVFTGVPESDYTFQICGIQGGPVRIQEMSWGAVKARFRNPSARASGEANGAREPRRPVVRRTISRGTPAADRPWDRSSARAPLKDRGKPSGVSGSPEGGVLKP